jgi:hypothetical protein
MTKNFDDYLVDTRLSYGKTGHESNYAFRFLRAARAIFLTCARTFG